jgi:lysophospholipase L1-like esterase
MKILSSVVVASVLLIPTAYAQTASQTPSQPCNCEDLNSELVDTQKQLVNSQKVLQDWPNIARYHDANASVQRPTNDEKRVVFMGDSITDAWVRPEYGGFFPGKPYIDRGISGQTTPQMLIRFRPDVIALQPKVVLILAGTNDIAGNTGPMTLDQIEGNLQSMDELAHANKVRVVLASVMPVSNYGHDREGKPVDMRIKRQPEKILELNTWIKKYAAAHGDIYLDYFTAMVDEHGLLRADISDDGLHPNAKGYTIMSPLAEASIAQALKKAKTK